MGFLPHAFSQLHDRQQHLCWHPLAGDAPGDNGRLISPCWSGTTRLRLVARCRRNRPRAGRKQPNWMTSPSRTWPEIRRTSTGSSQAALNKEIGYDVKWSHENRHGFRTVLNSTAASDETMTLKFAGSTGTKRYDPTCPQGRRYHPPSRRRGHRSRLHRLYHSSGIRYREAKKPAVSQQGPTWIISRSSL